MLSRLPFPFFRTVIRTYRLQWPYQINQRLVGMPAVSLTSSPKGPEVGEAPPSYLAPDLMVRGRIVCRGTVEIDGMMEGDIDANNLIIGPQGRTRASVVANDTVVSGAYEGVIKSRCVTFTDGCDFEGEVQYEALGMEANADVRGSMFPVFNADARTAIAQQAHTRREVIRSHSRQRRSPLAQSTGEHYTPASKRPAHSPVRLALWGVLSAFILLIAFGFGMMVINPAARDWRASLISTLAKPPASPAPEAVDQPMGEPPGDQAVAKPQDNTTATPATSKTPATTAPNEAAQDPALAEEMPLYPPRTVINGVLLPTTKPPVPEKGDDSASLIAQQAAAEKAAAEKAAAEKAAAEKAAAEKAAAEKAAAEKAAAEKAAAEKAAAEKAAAEKAAAEKAAAEKAAAEKAAAEKTAAEKTAAEKAATAKAAAEKAATEKAAADKAAAEKAAAAKTAAEKAASEKTAAAKAAADKAAAEKTAAAKAATDKATAEKAAAEKAATAKAAAEKAAIEKAAAEKAAKAASGKAATEPRRTTATRSAPAAAAEEGTDGACSWVLKCSGPGDTGCVSVRQCE
jgi:cytoskeletal protein CcmA (bactofilin family)